MVVLFFGTIKTLTLTKLYSSSQGGPLEHVIAAKAICFKEALDPSFKDYAKTSERKCKCISFIPN